MKTVAVFLLLAVTCQHIQADYVNDLRDDLVVDFATRAIGDRFKAMLEEFKKLMRTGNTTLGIPVLDPLDIDHQKFDIEEEKFNFKGAVDNLNVNGLSDYIVQDADFKISKWNASFDMLWSDISGKTKYEIDGYVLDKIPVYGEGDVSFEASGFRFATQAKLKVNYIERKILIESFNNTIIALEKLKLEITGLYNNDELSEFVSAVASDIVPEGINDFQEEITTEVNKLMLKYGNQFLDQYTLDDILKLIS